MKLALETEYQSNKRYKGHTITKRWSGHVTITDNKPAEVALHHTHANKITVRKATSSLFLSVTIIKLDRNGSNNQQQNHTSISFSKKLASCRKLSQRKVANLLNDTPISSSSPQAEMTMSWVGHFNVVIP